MTSAPEPGRRPGRPARLDRDQIVEAVFSGGSLDELTMRELAGRLGVSHAALYRWVKDRDELFEFVCQVMIDRVLLPERTGGRRIRPWLGEVAWAIHDQFLSVPGFATRLLAPHRHSSHFGRMRGEIIAAFVGAGVSPEMSEQSCSIFITSIVSWLAAHETREPGEPGSRFDLFLGTLLRGLPAREPGVTARGGH